MARGRRKPKGENSLGARDLFKQRKLYKKKYDGKDNTIDFWYGDCLYGRVDSKGHAVYPTRKKLKQFPASEGVFALNFVVDAYSRFKSDFIGENKQNPAFWEDPHLNPKRLIPLAAWININTIYHAHIQNIYTNFASSYLPINLKAGNPVVNFDDFVHMFLHFISRTAVNSPVTRTNLVKSLTCSPSINGLCVDLRAEGHALDLPKHEGWYQSRFFSSYMAKARKHGFMIDKNAPWRLVADINSLNMQAYMSRYALTVDNIYKKCYVKSWLYDIPALRIYLKQFYESYLASQPLSRDPKGQVITRTPMSDAEFENVYGSGYWLDLYVRVRHEELSKKMSKVEIKNIIERAKNIRKHHNIKAAAKYINKQLLGQQRPFLDPGTKTYMATKNLYTVGGEYAYSNGKEYVGYYHIHSELGPMVGREHTSDTHAALYRITAQDESTRSVTIVDPTRY